MKQYRRAEPRTFVRPASSQRVSWTEFQFWSGVIGSGMADQSWLADLGAVVGRVGGPVRAGQGRAGERAVDVAAGQNVVLDARRVALAGGLAELVEHQRRVDPVPSRLQTRHIRRNHVTRRVEPMAPRRSDRARRPAPPHRSQPGSSTLARARDHHPPRPPAPRTEHPPRPTRRSCRPTARCRRSSRKTTSRSPPPCSPRPCSPRCSSRPTTPRPCRPRRPSCRRYPRRSSLPLRLALLPSRRCAVTPGPCVVSPAPVPPPSSPPPASGQPAPTSMHASATAPPHLAPRRVICGPCHGPCHGPRHGPRHGPCRRRRARNRSAAT